MASNKEDALNKMLAMKEEAQADLSSIQRLTDQAQDLGKQILETEAQLNDLEQRLRYITDSLIPDALREAGIGETKTIDGVEIKLKEICSGSLPKEPDERAKALEWARKNGWGDSIKNTITITLQKGEDKDAEELKSKLLEKGLLFETKETIHHGTVNSMIKEQLELELSGQFHGEKLDQSLFKVYEGTVAKVGKPLKRKYKK